MNPRFDLICSSNPVYLAKVAIEIVRFLYSMKRSKSSVTKVDSCFWGLYLVSDGSKLLENDQRLRSIPKTMEPLISQGFHLSERRDLNPRPLLPQSSALPSCATPRQS